MKKLLIFALCIGQLFFQAAVSNTHAEQQTARLSGTKTSEILLASPSCEQWSVPPLSDELDNYEAEMHTRMLSIWKQSSSTLTYPIILLSVTKDGKLNIARTLKSSGSQETDIEVLKTIQKKMETRYPLPEHYPFSTYNFVLSYGSSNYYKLSDEEKNTLKAAQSQFVPWAGDVQRVINWNWSKQHSRPGSGRVSVYVWVDPKTGQILYRELAFSSCDPVYDQSLLKAVDRTRKLPTRNIPTFLQNNVIQDTVRFELGNTYTVLPRYPEPIRRRL